MSVQDLGTTKTFQREPFPHAPVQSSSGERYNIPLRNRVIKREKHVVRIVPFDSSVGTTALNGVGSTRATVNLHEGSTPDIIESVWLRVTITNNDGGGNAIVPNPPALWIQSLIERVNGTQIMQSDGLEVFRYNVLTREEDVHHIEQVQGYDLDDDADTKLAISNSIADTASRTYFVKLPLIMAINRLPTANLHQRLKYNIEINLRTGAQNMHSTSTGTVDDIGIDTFELWFQGVDLGPEEKAEKIKMLRSDIHDYPYLQVENHIISMSGDNEQTVQVSTAGELSFSTVTLLPQTKSNGEDLWLGTETATTLDLEDQSGVSLIGVPGGVTSDYNRFIQAPRVFKHGYSTYHNVNVVPLSTDPMGDFKGERHGGVRVNNPKFKIDPSGSVTREAQISMYFYAMLRILPDGRVAKFR